MALAEGWAAAGLKAGPLSGGCCWSGWLVGGRVGWSFGWQVDGSVGGLSLTCPTSMSSSSNK